MVVWACVALALMCVGMSVKLVAIQSALVKSKTALEASRKQVAQLLTDHEDLRDRADARIKKLKRRNNELLERSIENSKPGDMLDALNELHKNDNG